MNSLPIVSVCMITYGHEKFIREAIEGILMQECNFKIELIIANDASPDSTNEIIQEIIENHPKKTWINYVYHKNNIGMMPNFILALKKCKGKYIAICEGDDYWNDPYKLQKQVNFLENNPDYVISCHDTKVINEKNEIIRESKLPNNWKRDLHEEDLIKGAFIMPLTMCFRNVIQEFPEEFYHVKNGDTFLISILGFHGKAKFQTEITPAAYREHIGGVWSLKSEINKLFGQQTTYYYMFLYYYKMKVKNIGVDFYFNCYQNTCFSIFERFVDNKDFKNGIITYLKFVFNCIKFCYFKSIYYFTKKSIKTIFP